MDTTLRTIFLTGLFALLGTVIGGIVKGYWDDDLAQRKLDSDLVLKALESPIDSTRLNTLDMLTQTHLISDEDVRKGVKAYRDNIRQHKTTSPQVLPLAAVAAPVVAPPTATLPPPLTPSTRLYLLTGNPSKVEYLKELRKSLTEAHFAIIEAKYLSEKNSARPVNAEIRYFFPADKQQAERLAEFFRIRFNNANLAATLYGDTRVTPGYIEIWTGR